jgi:hypothetical protein
VIAVELAPDVLASLRKMADDGTAPPRCQQGLIRNAIETATRRLVADDLDGSVRPWDLPELRHRGADLGQVEAARAVSVKENVLVAELVPGGQRIVFRGVDDGWRLVRFADGADIALRPEATRRVELYGRGPDSVLAALGITKPDSVELEVESEDLGQGETETRYRYQWTDGGRSILAEEIKTEIFDGATPYSTYVRGVIVDGDRGVLLHGRNDSAVIVEG